MKPSRAQRAAPDVPVNGDSDSPVKPGPRALANGHGGEDGFSAQVAQAENINLRERLGRLEASIAFWAADLDEANEQIAALRAELEDSRRALRASEDRAAALMDQRASLVEDVSARDDHIASLEARVMELDLESIDGRRLRPRLAGIWRRLRARLFAQAEEIEGLRRTLSAGHAARAAVERELRQAHADAARNARYLDKLEERLGRSQSNG